MSHLNCRTNQCEFEVQKIIHLQSIMNQLPHAFTDNKKVTKSHILAMNTPIKINVPERQLTNTITNQSKTRLMHGRPVDPKDTVPQKRWLQ